MYFWLNYRHENHVERIPIPMKNLNHLFHLASEIMEAGRLHLLFFFLTALEFMIMNTLKA